MPGSMPPTPALSTDAIRRLAEAVDGHTRGGRWAEAEAACRSALANHPTDGRLLQMLGIVLVRAGRLPDAIDVLRQATAVGPTPDAWMGLGVALMTAKQATEEAVTAFTRASAGRPGWAEADANLGNLLLELKRPGEAEAAFRRAVAARPTWSPPLIGLGNALFAQGRLDEALACYERAVALNPNDATAVLNVGNVLATQRRRPAAIDAFRRCLALRPDDARAFNNLGTALYLDGQLDEAEAIFRRLLVDRPTDAELIGNLAGLLKDKARLDEAVALGRRAVAADPASMTVHSNLVYATSFHPAYGPGAVLAEARAFDAAHTAHLTAAARPHGNDPTPGRRLRVGYVSPDLRRHAVGQFMLPLVEHYDPAAIDVTLYGLSVAADDVTARLQQFARWRDLGGLSDAQAADAIRADGIDVLVDLSVHMGHNRLAIFARRPAPVQVTYLGYAGTTGLSAVDYRLSDPYLDPSPADDASYSERTVRLPRTYWCYRPMYDVAAVDAPPCETAGVVTFGSLNNFCKVNDAVLAAWGDVLLAVPDSRLVLHGHDGDHRQWVAGAFAGRGISPQRLAFVGLVPTSQYLSVYNQVDVGLDPFPYNGGTTTFDALWMGVPVVSLAGDRAVGRAGRSILTNVGLPELVADDVGQYVRTAVGLANDRARLRALRQSMRERLIASPVMDAAAFARDVEAAFRQMWQAWCVSSERRS